MPKQSLKQFIYAKMPPHLKKSINQAHLENGTCEQIGTHLERKLELNSLEYPDETSDEHCDVTNNKLTATQIMLEISTMTQTTLSPTITKMTENLELSTLLVRHVAKRTTLQRDVYVGANAANRPLPWKNKPQEQDAHNSITGYVQATAQHF